MIGNPTTKPGVMLANAPNLTRAIIALGRAYGTQPIYRRCRKPPPQAGGCSACNGQRKGK